MDTASDSFRGNLIDPQDSTRRSRGADDRVPGYFHGGSLSMSQSTITPTSAVESNSMYMLSAHGSIGQQQSQPRDAGMFNRAHDCVVTGTFIESNVTHNNATSNRFMEMLLEKTIPGAAFDSSARDPPPRCHPGTRLVIIERCLEFIRNSNGAKKMRWVVGAAGVGKSAIMQNVAESPLLPVANHASVFFSVFGRSDGTKTILTLSYQLAAKSEPYRQLIEQEITRDPSLLQSSMAKQFQRFIIEPFIHHPQLNSSGRILIIIDGLDECNNARTQQELLRLISDFCTRYPSSPIVWLIASRPETHITSFFSRRNVADAYETEEILVDSKQAREDVERFLRHELTEIRETFDLRSKWPEERDLWKLANASGGLFAYADTAMRYIGDLGVGNPASQLSDVLNVIDNHPMTHLTREQHPMALLDALYTRILTNIPPKIMTNTRKLLLNLASPLDFISYFYESNFLVLCNWLGLTCDDAYAAVNHLRSVLHIPRRNAAHKEDLKHFHKSFIDYILDFNRSEFSPDVTHEAQQFDIQQTFVILKEAPDNVDFGDADYTSIFGDLMRGPGASENISLTWLVDEEAEWDDSRTRLNMYKRAIGRVVVGIARGEPTFQTESCVTLVTTRFKTYTNLFPFHELRDLVFNDSRRSIFLAKGILKLGHNNAIRSPDMVLQLEVWVQERYSRSNRHSCVEHKWKCEREEGNIQGWATEFSTRKCNSCRAVFYRNLEGSTPHSEVILFTSTGVCCVEFIRGPWTYRFWYKFPLEERRTYGSTV